MKRSCLLYLTRVVVGETFDADTHTCTQTRQITSRIMKMTIVILLLIMSVLAIVSIMMTKVK